MNSKDLLFLGLIGAAAYLVWQALQGTANAVGTATTAAGNAVGGSLFDLFNPNAAGQTQFATVQFPDGAHTVAYGIISSSGQVTIPANDASGTYVTPAVSAMYGGQTFQLTNSGSGFTATPTG